MLKLWVRCHTNTRRGFVATLAGIFFILTAASASAALPAPRFIPGFPMQAGNIIMIMWTPVPGAVKYKIYMNGKVKGEAVAPPFQMDAPTKSGTYDIDITAIDPGNAESPHSSPGQIKIISLEPPKELNTRIQEGKVFILWSTVSGAAIYNVYRSPVKGKDYKLVGSVQDNKFADSSVEKGKTYYYVVSSKDITGKESDFSKDYKIVVPKEVAAKGKKGEQYPISVETSEEVLSIASTFTYEIKEVSDLLYLGSKVYAVDQGVGDVKVFNMAGEGKVFIPHGVEDSQVNFPVGIGKGPGETILVTEGLSKIIKVFDQQGKLVRKFSMPGMPGYWSADVKSKVKKGAGSAARDGDTSSDGKIYVVDDVWNRVVEFDENGKVVAQHGIMGTKPGEFFSPKSIVTLPDNKIAVGEGLGRRVQVFDPSFKPVKEFGKAIDWVGAFLSLKGMAATPDGKYIVVADGPMYTIQYFDTTSFKYSHHLGGEDLKLDEKMKNQRPVLIIGMPVGLAVDDDNRVWISNPRERRIVVRKITGPPTKVEGR